MKMLVMRKINYLMLITLFISCNVFNFENKEIQLPYYQEASFTPYWMKEGDSKLDTFHKVASFELTDQKGRIVNNATFQNMIYITDFFFTTCPGICPRMTENMQDLQDQFKDYSDVLLLSHSVTPERDSVEVLAKYAERYDVDSEKWFMVTGDRQEIYTLGRKSYFVEEDLGLERDIDEFLHTENFVLVDHNGFIRGIYNGLNKVSLKHLVSDVKLLRKEKMLRT